MYNILVINPGSTSTKIALYHDEEQVWKESVEHDAQTLKQFDAIFDQLEWRTDMVIKAFLSHGEKIEDLSVVMARGGMIGPVPAGAIEVTPAVIEALRDHPVAQHASNLGAPIAYGIAQKAGIKAYIYDPVTVDEMIDIARVTGLKDIVLKGEGHNLNMRAAALKVCREDPSLDYYNSNIIVTHMGGGISISLHSNGRIIDRTCDEDGAFSPERAGALPAKRLIKKLYTEGYDMKSALDLVSRHGGLLDHLGTTDTRVVEKMALEDGDAHAKLIYDAMILNVARCIARVAVIVNGKIDRIVVTGGIAFSEYVRNELAKRVSWIAPLSYVPGENEMQALASGGVRVLSGEEKALIYEG